MIIIIVYLWLYLYLRVVVMIEDSFLDNLVLNISKLIKFLICLCVYFKGILI